MSYISLSEAKAHLHIEPEFTEQDNYILGIISAAELGVYEYCNGGLDVYIEDIEIQPDPVPFNNFPAEGLINLFNMDEGEGIEINDSIGDLVGTIDANWIEGIREQALELDGTTTNALIPNVIFPENVSISAWFYIDGAQATGELDLLTKENVIKYRYNEGIFSVVYNLVSDSMAPITDVITDTNIYPTDRWYNLVFTYEKNGNMNFYVNSVLADYVPVTDDYVLLDTTTPLVLGSSTEDTVVGKVDELAIWDRAITPQEITLMYSSGAGLFWYPDIVPEPEVITEYNMPVTVKQATLLLIAHFYVNRQVVAFGVPSTVPYAFGFLLDFYRNRAIQ